eukprot:gnl/TRDRNA2_/TRDRNA2_145241_c0_seq4.p1 gnl/TRDRNA2_/TRDRNA2_145241_c0~~gnl/TRDRNA2_/TRDRNA2_145241_c0_seq4.p1  ORF type:complete len:661 (-),score=111.95 gnl/TRDRNA2_/TRDRNA2_145241_c0_seq4:210-1895(-)
MGSDESAWTEFGYCLLRAQQEPEEEEVKPPPGPAAAPAFDREALMRLARQAAENPPEPEPAPAPAPKAPLALLPNGMLALPGMPGFPKMSQPPPELSFPSMSSGMGDASSGFGAPSGFPGFGDASSGFGDASSGFGNGQAYDPEASAAPAPSKEERAPPPSFGFGGQPKKDSFMPSAIPMRIGFNAMPPPRPTPGEDKVASAASRASMKDAFEDPKDAEDGTGPSEAPLQQSEWLKRLEEDGPKKQEPPKPQMQFPISIQPTAQKTAPPVDQSALQRFTLQAKLAQQAAESGPKMPPPKTPQPPAPRPEVQQQREPEPAEPQRGIAVGYDHAELWLPPKSERLLQEQRAQEDRTEAMMRQLEAGKTQASAAAAAVPTRRSRSRDRDRGRRGRSRSDSRRRGGRGRSDSRRRRMSRSRSRSPVRSRTRSKSIKRNPPKKYGSKWDMGPADPQAAPQSTVMPRSMPGSMAQPHKVAANEHYIVLRLSDAQIKRMIGKAGSRINEIRARTGSDIRIYGGTVSIVKNASATEQLIRQVLLEQGLPMMADNEVVTRRGYGTTVDRK